MPTVGCGVSAVDAQTRTGQRIEEYEKDVEGLGARAILRERREIWAGGKGGVVVMVAAMRRGCSGYPDCYPAQPSPTIDSGLSTLPYHDDTGNFETGNLTLSQFPIGEFSVEYVIPDQIRGLGPVRYDHPGTIQ